MKQWSRHSKSQPVLDVEAAQVAAGELGAPAGSAAGLVYQHGWRWDDQRTWTRLTTGEVDPVSLPGRAASSFPGA